MASLQQSESFDNLKMEFTKGDSQDARTDRETSLLAALAAGPSRPLPAEIDPAAIAHTTPNWTTGSKAFAPMRMTKDMTSTSHQPAQILSGKEIISRQLANCSLSYAGDASRWRNKNALVPESQNTSIWITRLPAGVTYKELLGGIRNTGRVWSSFINKPEHHKGIHTAAAKVVFFEALAAQRFLAQCNGPDGTGLVIRGHKATVRHNRNTKSEEQTNTYEETHHMIPPSRVLVITGPPFVIHPPTLLRYFAARFNFEIETIMPVVEGPTFSVYEWRFASFNCQAQAASIAINRDSFFGNAGVTVTYGVDPCDHFGRF